MDNIPVEITTLAYLEKNWERNHYSTAFGAKIKFIWNKEKSATNEEIDLHRPQEELHQHLVGYRLQFESPRFKAFELHKEEE